MLSGEAGPRLRVALVGSSIIRHIMTTLRAIVTALALLAGAQAFSSRASLSTRVVRRCVRPHAPARRPPPPLPPAPPAPPPMRPGTPPHRHAPSRGSNGGARVVMKDFPKPPQLENTYQLDPGVRFNVKLVETVMQQILESRLQHAQYSDDAAKTLTTELTDTIKVKIKTLGFSRHKLVCHVIIGPVGGQCVRVASRCVWDEKHDDYASTSYTNSSLFAVAMAYGIYFE